MGRRMGGLRNGGRGVRTCDASGFLRPAQRIMEDVRQGDVAREFADTTSGFGTEHPLDNYDPGPMDDPTPIARPGSSTLDLDDLPSGDPIDPDYRFPTLDGWEGD